MSEPREIEAKFEAGPDVLERLLRLRAFAGFTVAAKPEQVQDDVYFDTQDEILKQSGASLRIRRKGGQLQMTFKGDRQVSSDDSNVVSRLEDQVLLAGVAESFDPAAGPLIIEPLPSPLKRTRELTARGDLLPVARLMTSRIVLTARNIQNHEIEIAVDRCLATRLMDNREVQFVEVEAELIRGDAVVLYSALTDLMRSVPGLQPSSRTKLERALE
jgi:inorganic triphosphatase YgiF